MEIPRVEHAMSGKSSESETPSEESSKKKPARRSRTTRSKKSPTEASSEAQTWPDAIDTAAAPEETAPAVVAVAEDNTQPPAPMREQNTNRRGGRGRGRSRDAEPRNNGRGGAALDASMPSFIAQSFTERLKAEGRDPSTINTAPEDDELPSIVDDADDLSLTQASEAGIPAQEDHA